MNTHDLDALVYECQQLIDRRFPGSDGGAAAMLTESGTILLGTAPDANNPAVEVCHETEPYCAAHRLGESIVATICLYREPGAMYRVLTPCGVCQERLATHGPDLLAAVPQEQSTTPGWVSLRDLMPHYWFQAFDDAPAMWSNAKPSA